MVKLKYKGLKSYKGVPCGIGALQRFYGISRYQYHLYLTDELKGAFSEDKHNRIKRAVESENTREDSLYKLAVKAYDNGGKVDDAFMAEVEKTAMMPLSLQQLYEFLRLEPDEQ